MKLPIVLAVRASLRLTLGSLLIGLLPGAVLGQGGLISWGMDFNNQVTDTPTAAGFTQLELGKYHSMALRPDGSIAAWGQNGYGAVSSTPTGSGYLQLAGGDRFGLALRADGSLETWGSDTHGQGANTPAGTGFTQVAAGGEHALALRADGSIAAWGYDWAGQVSGTPAGTGFTHLACGESHSMALRPDGSIVAWGSLGASGTPGGTGFVQLAGGGGHSLALHGDGSLAAWGIDDSFGQISNTPAGAGFLQVAAGTKTSAALRADGSIAIWGRDLSGQVSLAPAATGYSQVCLADEHAAALGPINDGAAYCFGDGSGAACPCAASGPAGRGCANSAGFGARLIGFGTASLSADTFRLTAGGTPDAKPGLILRGANPLNGGLGTPTGAGLLCTGGQTARSQIQFTYAYPSAFTVPGVTTFTDFQGSPFGASCNGVGVPTNYQFWYRDPQETCSGSGFNFSNAWTVTWGP